MLTDVAFIHQQLLLMGFDVISVKGRETGGHTEYQVALAAGATQEDFEAANAAITGFDMDGDSKLIQAIRQTAASAAGVTLNDLTAVQIKSLLAIVLYKFGGVDLNGKVRPLNEWA